MSELKNQISQFIDTNAKIYQDISLAIHASQKSVTLNILPLKH